MGDEVQRWRVGRDESSRDDGEEARQTHSHPSVRVTYTVLTHNDDNTNTLVDEKDETTGEGDDTTRHERAAVDATATEWNQPTSLSSSIIDNCVYL